MTSEQIRNITETLDPDASRPEEKTVREVTRLGYSSSQFVVLREIAAQLAEQNEQMREDREFRRIAVEEERAARIKRDEMLSGYGGTLGKVADTIARPSPGPAVMLEGVTTHLGCFLRLPDGTHALAVEGGIINLDPAEAERILALTRKPEEGKPQ